MLKLSESPNSLTHVQIKAEKSFNITLRVAEDFFQRTGCAANPPLIFYQCGFFELSGVKFSGEESHSVCELEPIKRIL